jgi:hypothetical protein
MNAGVEEGVWAKKMVQNRPMSTILAKTGQLLKF